MPRRQVVSSSPGPLGFRLLGRRLGKPGLHFFARFQLFALTFGAATEPAAPNRRAPVQPARSAPKAWAGQGNGWAQAPHYGGGDGQGETHDLW